MKVEKWLRQFVYEGYGGLIFLPVTVRLGRWSSYDHYGSWFWSNILLALVRRVWFGFVLSRGKKSLVSKRGNKYPQERGARSITISTLPFSWHFKEYSVVFLVRKLHKYLRCIS